MNILGDFINRVNSLYPEEIDNDQLDSLLTTIKNQGDEIQVKDNEIVRLKTRLTKAQEDVDKLNAKLDKLTEKRRLLQLRPQRARQQLPPARLPNLQQRRLTTRSNV